MDFKIDENLPIDVANLLRQAGYDAITVLEERLGGPSDLDLAAVCQAEQRTLITLDTGFADIRAYPPAQFPGLIVLRVHRQDKPYVLGVVERLVPMFSKESVEHRLWIVEETRVRIRS